MKNTQIIGSGHYVPEQTIANEDLKKWMDTSDEWIRERTGIQERRWVKPGETQLDLAYNASIMALEQAQKDPGEIDMIIVGCVASDRLVPGASCYLQEKLGLPGVPTLDIRNGCSGFVYGLAIADKFIKTGTYQNILLVGAEIQSTAMNLSTEGRGTAVIFADGAGAVVLSATDQPGKGVLSTHLHADGRYADMLTVPLPSISQHPFLPENIGTDENRHPFMDGRKVFKHAITRFPEVILEALDSNGLQKEDIDLLIPHQANLRITEAVGKRLGLSENQVYSNIQRYGNTTAASIPIALSEAWREGLIQPDTLLCLAAFGAGFTWGSVLIRF